MVILLLLLSNAAIIVSGYSDYILLIEQRLVKFSTFLFGISYGTYILFFNMSHFLLAERYRRMAKQVPAQLDNQPAPVTTMCEKITYWVLFSLNILAPIGYIISCVMYQTQTRVTMKPTNPHLK